MKKIIYFILLLLLVYDTKGQNISFSSNGHVNHFTKIDTLYFTEYAGKKPSTKTVAIDTTFSRSLMQFDSSFGFTSKTLADAKVKDSKLTNFKKVFSTSFYTYTDGALQAPTSVLFFKPKTDSAVIKRFSPIGKVVKHPGLNGYYYLYIKTDIYTDGDKIFALCDSLNNAGLTVIVEPVFVRQLKLGADPFLPNEWNVSNTGQYGGTPGADMKVANVWNMGYTGTGVKVAVIDLGIDLTHPDLEANLLTGFDATGNNSGGAPIYDQYNTHGTECAGIIGEIANTIGGAGVAYNVHIIPIRFGTVAPPNVNPNGYITTNDTWESNCFNYAVNSGADIISNSWGLDGGSPSSQLNAAISNAITNGRAGKGSLVLFAAGNENSSLDYPASNTNVIAVGASCECDTRKRSSNDPNFVNPGVSTDPLGVSCDGEFWWGSNFGTGLDVAAPGVDITTTSFTPLAGGGHTDTYVTNFNGTSAATPNAAAVLALILSANPNLTGQQARNILESSTDKVGGYTYQSGVSGQPNGTWSTDAGYGRINACAAIAQVLDGVLSILGDASFCSTISNSYTIPKLPTGVTITWSATPSGVVTINAPGSSQTTLTKTGNGAITLTATISNTCSSSPIVISKSNIMVGLPTAIGIDVGAGGFTNMEDCGNATDFGVLYNEADHNYAGYLYVTASNATSLSWTEVSNSSIPYWGWTTSNNGHTLNVSQKYANKYLSLKVTATNACGSINKIYDFNSGACFVSAPVTGDNYLLTPNPAEDNVTVSVNSASKNSEAVSFAQIRVYDGSGNLKKQLKYGSDTRQARINIADLRPGYYSVEISNGKTAERKPLVVQR